MEYLDFEHTEENEGDKLNRHFQVKTALLASLFLVASPYISTIWSTKCLCHQCTKFRPSSVSSTSPVRSPRDMMIDDLLNCSGAPTWQRLWKNASLNRSCLCSNASEEEQSAATISEGRIQSRHLSCPITGHSSLNRAPLCAKEAARLGRRT
jgi:hypothetical protein